MPKRIQLPSSDELFAEAGPRPGRGKPVSRKPPATAPRRSRRVASEPGGTPATGAETVAPPVAKRHAVAAAPPVTKRRAVAAAPPVTKRRAVAAAPPLAARLDRVEASLRDLPIDTLIDLRDGLEALLARGGGDPDGVERLLASTRV